MPFVDFDGLDEGGGGLFELRVDLQKFRGTTFRGS